MHRTELIRLCRGVALVAVACALFVRAAGAEGLNPCAVVSGYQRALYEQDFDGALALLADDATITLGGRTARLLTGSSQIRTFLRSGDPRSGGRLAANRRVLGNTVTWSEHIAALTSSTPDEPVEAVVVAGRIQSLAYGQRTQPADAGTPASDVTPEAATTVLGAEALLGLGLLSLATMRTRVRPTSTLRGRLLRELHHWRSVRSHPA
jgi:hypothetical protein